MLTFIGIMIGLALVIKFFKFIFFAVGLAALIGLFVLTINIMNWVNKPHVYWPPVVTMHGPVHPHQ